MDDLRTAAKALLDRAGITSNQSWDSLDNAQREAITDEAGMAYQAKHGKPTLAGNESFVRKRFDLLQQRARS